MDDGEELFTATNGSGALDKGLLQAMTRRDHRVELTYVRRTRVSVGPSTLGVEAGFIVGHPVQLVD